MQGQLSKQRAAPSPPSVIAQLCVPEDQGRRGWVTKQPGPGTCWHGLPSSGASDRLGQRGPGEEAGEPAFDCGVVR